MEFRYYIGVCGELTFSFGPYTTHDEVVRKRLSLLAQNPQNLSMEDVVIVHSSTEENAREQIRQWYAQVEAGRAAEQEERT